MPNPESSASAPSQFIHLHLHSAYSLAEGAIRIKDLIKSCTMQKIPAVAVTDTNNMFGAMEFAQEASKSGVQSILGAQVNCGHENQQIVLLVQNETGYRNICRLLSDAYMSGDTSEVSVSWDDLAQYNDGLICLTGGTPGPVNQYLLHNQDKDAKAFMKKMKGWFGDRLYVELQRHALPYGVPQQRQVEERLIDLAYDLNIPLVATNDCYFQSVVEHEAHDALLCISGGRYVIEEDRRKATKHHYLKSPADMIELFADLPEAINNTIQIAKRCSYQLESIDPLLPPFETDQDAQGNRRSEVEELKAQATEGLKWRLENFVDKDTDHKPYFERLEFELKVIMDMGFPGYFLICSDFIKWAKDQNIPVGPGRGSGAGSVVAWSLKITDPDPLELGLLFERFLNPERISMPDFDIDFCQTRRDEVIRYVQDKYGHDHVAQIITFGKLQARAVVRDVGRVLQLPYGQVDRIAKLIPNNPAAPMTLQEALDSDVELRLERDKDETQGKLINIALKLEGLYRHASTHAAGVVIGDRPLHQLVPLYRDQKSDMPVTQFNMKYVEQAGLVKFDFLGLKTMTVIQKTVELINSSPKNYDPVDILKVPLDDQGAYKIIAKGDTVGVFQLESAGMRDALRKVKPDCFEDIIALVSLYRPGPMDNIPLYVSNKEGKTEPDYMHPKLKPILEKTYGIMIYQEQVLQAAQILAGYTLGGADFLRKAMGKKIKEEMDKQREMFISGAAEHNDVPEKQASEIFDQIAKFAGYGFNRAHASCYALIGYWTAWLKANYPVEFMAASMTLDLGNTEKLSVFKQDLDRMKIELKQPNINKSHPDFAVEGDDVRYALAALKSVGAAAMQNVVNERESRGAFKSIADFAERIDSKAMNKRQFEQLAGAGAFDALNDNRAQVRSAAEMILRHAQALAAERESGQVNLFGGGDGGGTLGLPDLAAVKKWDPLEKLSYEFGAVGFYLSAHPLDSREGQLEAMKIMSYASLEAALANKPAVRAQMAGVLLKKQERVSQKGSKFAFLQLSDPSGIYEITLFSETLNAAREYLVPGESLLVSVDAETREDQVRMTCGRVEPLEAALEGKIREIQIHMDDARGLPKIKECLNEENDGAADNDNAKGGRGMAKIMLFVTIDDTRVAKTRLPGTWSLSSNARNAIRTEDGVRDIFEV
jgi:DNA polymerase-3 subunit alpha